MAEPNQQIIDALGRTVDALNLNTAEIQSLIASAKTGAPKAVNPPSASQEEAIKQLTEAMTQFTTNFQNGLKEQKEFMNKTVSAMKDVKGKREDKSKKGKDKKEKSKGADNRKAPEMDAEEMSVLKKLTDNLYKDRQKYHQTDLLDAVRTYAQQNRITKEQVAQLALDKEKGAEVRSSLESLTKQASVYRKYGDVTGKLSDQFYTLRSGLEYIPHALGLDVMGTLFGNIGKGQMDFIRDVRRAAYETDGLLAGHHELNRSYEDLGLTVHKTGVEREKFEKSYLKALKTGVKDRKLAAQLATQSLHTEEQLGLEAGSLQQTFQEFAVAGKFNNAQLAQMGRGMQEVARNTGLTGEALTSAMNSAKGLQKAMRGSGQLTAEAATNMLELAANGQKLDVADEINALAKGLSSSHALFNETSKGMQNLIIMSAGAVGQFDKASSGAMLKTKQGIKDLSAGMEKTLKSMGIESREQFESLSDEAKRDISFRMQAMFQMDAGQALSTLEALKESGKDYTDKLKDIDKQLEKNLTTQEKSSLLEKKAAIQSGAAMSALTKVSEAAKGAQDMSDAYGKMNKDSKKALEDAYKAVGGTGDVGKLSEKEMSQTVLTKQMESVNAQLKAMGKDQMKLTPEQIAEAAADPKKFQDAMSIINEGMQVVATQQKANLTPQDQTNLELKKLNDYLSGASNKLLSSFFDSSFAKFVFMAAALGGIAAGAIKMTMTLLSIKAAIETLAYGGEKKEGGIVENIKRYLGIEKKKPEEGLKEAEVKPTSTKTGEATKAAGKEAEKQKVSPEQVAEAKAKAAAKVEATGKTQAEIRTERKLQEKKIEADESLSKAQKKEKIRELRGVITPERPQEAVETAGKQAGKQKWTAEQVAQAKADAKARAESAGMDQAMMRAQRKQQEKKDKEDAILSSKEKKQITSETRRGKDEEKIIKGQKRNITNEAKNIDASKKAGKKAEAIKKGPAIEGEVGPSTDPESMKALGGDFAKTAAGAAVLGAGALLLGTALVYLGDKVLKALGLDVSKIIEVAAAIGAIAAVGAAVAVASVAAYKELSEGKASEMGNISGDMVKTCLKAVAAITIIGPAIVLIGTAMVWLASKLFSMLGMDLTKVAETAAVLVAVAGVAGAVALGVGEFVEAMDKMGESKGFSQAMNNPGKILAKVAKGSIAILGIGAAIIIIGGVLVWLAKTVLGFLGIDAKTALEVAAVFAALSAAILTIAVGGGLVAVALFALGAAAPAIISALPLIGIGALVLAGLAAGLIVLGMAIGGLVKGLLWIGGALGLDGPGLIQASNDLAAFMTGVTSIAWTIAWGAVKIAVALVAMAAALVIGIPAMVAGGIALGACAVALAALSVGIWTVYKATSSWTAEDMTALGENIAAFMVGVRSTLGTLSWQGIKLAATLAFLAIGMAISIPAMAAGAIALGAFAIAIAAMALAVWGLQKSLLNWNPSEIQALNEQLSGFISGVGSIVWTISSNALTIAGIAAFAIGAPVLAAGLVAGGAGLVLIAGGMAILATGVMGIASALENVNVTKDMIPEFTTKIDNLIAVAIGIAKAVFWNTVALGKLAAELLASSVAIGLMGTVAIGFNLLAIPMKSLAESMIGLGKVFSESINQELADEITSKLDLLVNTLTAITGKILWMAGLMAAMSVGMVAALASVPLMYFAAGAMWAFSEPLKDVILSMFAVGQSVADTIEPSLAQEIVDNLDKTYNAVWDICSKIIGITTILGITGIASTISLMSVPIILFGAASLRVFGYAMKTYLDAVVDVSQTLSDTIDEELSSSLISGLNLAFNTAAEISATIIKMAAMMPIIAAGLAMSLFAIPTIYGAAIALKLLAAPLETYVTTARDTADLLGNIISKELGETLSNLLNDCFNAAYTISLSMMAIAAKMPIISLGLAFATAAIPTILAAALSLALLTPPLMLYMVTARETSKLLGSIMSKELGEELSGMLRDCFDAAFLISTTFMGIAAKMPIIALGLGIALLASPLIIGATLAIAALSIPLYLFAIATKDAADLIGSVMSKDLGNELSEMLYDTFDAALLISNAFMGIAAKMPIIALGLGIAALASPLIVGSTLAIAALSIPLYLFAIATKDAADLIGSVMSKDLGNELSEMLRDTFDAALLISNAFMGIAAKMPIIALGLGIAALASPLITGSTLAIAALSVPLYLFAITARKAADLIGSVMSKDLGNELSEMLYDTFDAAHKISTAFMGIAAQMPIIALGLGIAALASPLIVGSTLAIAALSVPLYLFAIATKEAADLIGSVMSKDLGEELSENLSNTFDAAYKISTVFIGVATQMPIIALGLGIAALALPLVTGATIAIAALSVPLYLFAITARKAADLIGSVMSKDLGDELSENLSNTFDAAYKISTVFIGIATQMPIIALGLGIAILALPLVTGATIAIAALSVPLYLFAITARKAADLIGSVMSKDLGDELSENLSNTFDAALLIGSAFMKIATQMPIIALGLGIAILALPLVTGATIAIAALSIPLYLFAITARKAADLIGSVMSKDLGNELSEMLRDTFDAAYKISTTFMDIAAQMPIIALGLGIALLALPLVTGATIAIAALSVPLYLFAITARKAADLIGSVMSKDLGDELSENLSNTFDAAYKISTVFIGIATQMPIIALGLGIAILALPLVTGATIAIAALSIPLYLFAITARKAADLIGSVMSKDLGDELSEMLRDCFDAANKISTTFMGIAAQMPIIALGLGIAALASPLIVGSTIAIAALSVPLYLFAITAREAADLIGSVMSKDLGDELSEMLRDTFDAAYKISTTFMDIAAQMPIIALGLGIAILALPLVTGATIAIAALSVPLYLFAITARKAADLIGSVMSKDLGDELSENLSDTFDAAYKISLTIMGISAKLTVIGSGMFMAMFSIPLIYGIGLSISKLSSPILYFVASAKNAAKIIGDVMPKDVAEELVENLNSAFNAAYNIAISMMAMSAKLAIIGVGFGIALLATPILYFATGTILSLANPLISFINAAALIGQAITSVFDPNEMESISDQIISVIDSAASIGDALVIMGTKMAVIGAGVVAAFFATPLMYMAGKTLKILAKPLQSFIDTATTVFPVEEVQASQGKLDAIVGMFDSLQNLMGGIVTAASNLVIFRGFGKLFNFESMSKDFLALADGLKTGLIGPLTESLPSVTELEAVVAQLDSTVKVLSKVQDVVETMASVIASITMAGMDLSALGGIPFDKIGMFCSALLGGGKPTVAGAAGGGASNIGKAPSDMAIEKRIEGQQNESQMRTSKNIDELVNNALRGDGILVQPIGDIGNITAQAPEPVTAQTATADNASIQSKIQMHKVSTEPSKSKVSSEDLTEIAGTNETQVLLQKQLVDLFSKVLDALQPKNIPTTAGQGSTTDTASNTVPGRPANYFKTTTGSVAQGSAKAITNLGPPKMA